MSSCKEVQFLDLIFRNANSARAVFCSKRTIAASFRKANPKGAIAASQAFHGVNYGAYDSIESGKTKAAQNFHEYDVPTQQTCPRHYELQQCACEKPARNVSSFLSFTLGSLFHFMMTQCF
jgi:hypothetical protein